MKTDNQLPVESPYTAHWNRGYLQIFFCQIISQTRDWSRYNWHGHFRTNRFGIGEGRSWCVFEFIEQARQVINVTQEACLWPSSYGQLLSWLSITVYVRKNLLVCTVWLNIISYSRDGYLDANNRAFRMTISASYI